ncbi:MAG: HAMP domain-containing protein, partial [Acidobacteria bacterium]|nr:HAMP domain-containing protein [Acidobacteriota bacterium]
MMRIRSLRLKLAVINAILIAAVFACLASIRYAFVSYRARATFDRLLQEDARFLARRIAPEPEGGLAWEPGGAGDAQRLVLERLRPFLIITDADGKVLDSDTKGGPFARLLSGNLLDEMLRRKSGFHSLRAGDGRGYRFTSMPVRQTERAEEIVLHVGRSTDTLESLLQEHGLVYLYFLPAMVGASGIVGWYLAGRAVRPFRNVVQTAARITSENLNTRIRSPHYEEEVQTLVTAFNGMVSRLH